MSDLLVKIGNYFSDVLDNEGLESDKLKGLNGPYKQAETNLRTLCHLVCLFCYLSQNQPEYKSRVTKLVGYLVTKYRSGEKLLFRNDPNTDSTNGVMGPAWFLEALHFCDRYGIDFDRQIINNIIENHSWNTTCQGFLINVEDQDKFGRKIDKTFNHKLWFISMVAQFDIMSPSKINEILEGLMKFQSFPDTIIYHKSSIETPARNLKSFARKMKYYPKSVSYHPFNQVAARYLLASGKLNQNNRDILERVLNIRFSIGHLVSMTFNKYGVRYNPVGYEIPNLLANKKIKRFLLVVQNFLIGRALNSIMRTDGVNYIDLRLISRIYERSYDDFM